MSETKWISVEERMPDINTDVLVCNEDYGKSLLGFAICAGRMGRS